MPDRPTPGHSPDPFSYEYAVPPGSALDLIMHQLILGPGDAAIQDEEDDEISRLHRYLRSSDFEEDTLRRQRARGRFMSLENGEDARDFRALVDGLRRDVAAKAETEEARAEREDRKALAELEAEMPANGPGPRLCPVACAVAFCLVQFWLNRDPGNPRPEDAAFRRAAEILGPGLDEAQVRRAHAFGDRCLMATTDDEGSLRRKSAERLRDAVCRALAAELGTPAALRRRLGLHLRLVVSNP